MRGKGGFFAVLVPFFTLLLTGRLGQLRGIGALANSLAEFDRDLPCNVMCAIIATMLGKEKRHVLRVRSTFVVGALLVLVTLLALGLRLYRLDAQSLWYDEGFSVYLGRMDLAQITERTAADIQPPLYYYLLHGWIGFLGDGEMALRGLSLLFGVLTVPLI